MSRCAFCHKADSMPKIPIPLVDGEKRIHKFHDLLELPEAWRWAFLKDRKPSTERLQREQERLRAIYAPRSANKKVR